MDAAAGQKLPDAVARSGVLWVAFGASLWGFDSLFRHLLTRRFSATSIVLIEHLLLTALLLPELWRSRRRWLKLSARRWAAVLGLSWGGSALGTVCFTQAVKLGSATTAVLLQELQPIFAALLAWALLGEPEPKTARYWLRASVALAAAYLVTAGDGLYWPSWTDVRGRSAAYAVAAALIWGSSTVFGRYAATELSPMGLTALRIVVALPLLGALAWASEGFAWSWPQASDWLALAAMALLPGFAALVAYYYGLRRTHASLATLAELCFPAAATLINWLLLGERLSALQALGAAALVAAVLWARPKSAKTESAPA